MIKTRLALAAAVAVTVAASAHAQTFVIDAVGVYDATSNANVVDTVAVAGNANGAADSASTSDAFDVFKSNLTASFAAGFGGVCDFAVTGQGGDENVSGLNIRYGAGLSKTLPVSIAGIGGTGPNLASVGTSTPISGVRALQSRSDSGFRMTFGAITGGAAGEYVSTIALTLLSRNNAITSNGPQTGTVTATFVSLLNGSTQTASLGSIVGNTSGADDTFYTLTAPADFRISQIDVTEALVAPATTIRQRHADDLGFLTSAPVTVPEAGTLVLLISPVAGAALFGAIRRRRTNA